MADQHGNVIAREGCDRCHCGCKYWVNDRCIDCGDPVWLIFGFDTDHPYTSDEGAEDERAYF